MRSLIGTWVAALIVVAAAFWVFYNNDYMTYRNYPVTFVDRSAPTSCHKGRCHANHTGLFKLEDGTFFERPISVYMYTQMHLGERFELDLRPFDIRQTSSQNVWWFFIPAILFSAALVGFGMAVFETFTTIVKRSKK